MANRRLPEFLRPAEAEALIGAALSARDRLIVFLGLGAGLRVSEIVKLRVEDVDLAEGLLFVRLGKGKRDRYVPFPESLVHPLRDWVGDRRVGWVFPSPRKAGAPLSRRAVQYLVDRLKEAAGIVRRCTPHTMRHSYATSLLRNGADLTDVQRLLGHASPNITVRYLHCDPTRLKGVVSKLDLGQTKANTPPPLALPPDTPPG